MKELLQQVKKELEQAYDHPASADLDRCITQLQSAMQQYGDKGTMIENCIRSLTQARNAIGALENAGDISSAAAFGQAFNALEQAVESYTNASDNQLNL